MPQSPLVGWSKEIVTKITLKTTNFKNIFTLIDTDRLFNTWIRLANNHFVQFAWIYICSNSPNKLCFSVNIHKEKIYCYNVTNLRIEVLKEIAIKFMIFKSRSKPMMPFCYSMEVLIRRVEVVVRHLYTIIFPLSLPFTLLLLNKRYVFISFFYWQFPNSITNWTFFF